MYYQTYLVHCLISIVLNSGAGIDNAASEKLGKAQLKRLDRKFLKTLKKCKVELDLYGRYVDDVTTALASLDPGVEFKNGKIVFNQEKVEEDLKVPGDERTFRELVKIADSIYEYVQFTSECPSSHQEENVPVLYLKLYVSQDGIIVHEFYEKPVSCIPQMSAHSKRMKLAVMVEEGVRRVKQPF